jgi:hydroxypyruvate isomerase
MEGLMDNQRRNFIKASAALAATAGLAQAGQQQPQQPKEDVGRLGRTAHTRFAVNLEMWWGRLPFLERIDQAARLGFQAIEFWPWENKDIKAVAAACQKHKIEVAQFTGWGFRPGLNEPKNHADFVKKIQQGCDVCEQLNCRMMCVVAGDDVRGLTQAQMHQNVIDGLRRAVPIVEKRGITLILEPMNIRVDHKGHCLYGSEPTLRILKGVGSRNVKMLADLYHLQITEGDLCGHIRENYESAAYYQVADHPGRHEPGTGEIHFPRVLKQLHDLGYRGHVGLELRPRTTELEAARAVNRADQW